jgi:hypothetical protein
VGRLAVTVTAGTTTGHPSEPGIHGGGLSAFAANDIALKIKIDVVDSVIGNDNAVHDAAIVKCSNLLMAILSPDRENTFAAIRAPLGII